MRPLIFCLFLLFTLSSVAAQDVLVMPLKVSYSNDYDQTEATKSATFLESLTGQHKRVMDEKTTAKLRPALQKIIDKEARSLDVRVKTLHPGDLSEELQKEFEANEYNLYMLSSKGGFLNGRRYDNKVSERNAPFLNKLCDEYNVDRVVLINLTARNELALKKRGKKDPKGLLNTTAYLFDGNSGLLLKQKGRTKGAAEKIPNPYKLTEESIGKVLQGLLKSVL